ncbi:hypothetical protein Ccr5_gp196c [Caulobacter phage Ccr5]|nr:hypothetical protein Ccr5_gp196c [Caulobacter phage Ccr5]
MNDNVKSCLVGAGWYAAAYVVGVVILGFLAGYLYDRPHPPPYLDYFLFEHPTLTFLMSLIVAPIVAALTVGLVILVIMVCAAGV